MRGRQKHEKVIIFVTVFHGFLVKRRERFKNSCGFISADRNNSLSQIIAGDRMVTEVKLSDVLSMMRLRGGYLNGVRIAAKEWSWPNANL